MAAPKYRRGDTREDGKIFFCYRKRGAKEYWVSRERFLLLSTYALNASKRWNLAHPEKRKTINRACLEKHKVPRAAKRREWLNRNRELHNARGASWRRDNPAQRRQIAKKWYSENRDAALQTSNLWKANNRSRSSESNKAWRQNNPEKAAAKYAKRRARKQATPLSADQQHTLLTFFAARRRISQCLGIQFHVDHVIPLARGGPHAPSNLQLLPWKINIKKGAKLVHV